MKLQTGIHLTERPSISLLLWCGLIFWLGCYCALHTITPDNAVEIFGLSAVVLIILCGVLLACHFRDVSSLPIILLIAFVLGFTLWSNQILALDIQRSTLSTYSGKELVFRITEDPSFESYGTTAIAEVSKDSQVLGKVNLYLPNDSFTYGDEFRAKASFSTPKESNIQRYNSQGLLGNASIESYDLVPSSPLGMLIQARTIFLSVIDSTNDQYKPDEVSALLKGLVVGDRSELFVLPLYQEVKVLGLAHLVAVSGSHLVIIMGFIGLIFRALKLHKKFSIVLQISILCIYVCMVGFPISCIRAACMSIISILSFSVSRRPHAQSALGIVIMVFIITDPTTAFSLSFVLSAFSTLGILLFMPLFTSWIRSNNQILQTLVIDPIAMTFAALVLTFPISIATFSMFSVIAPLANCIATLFVTAICIVGLFAFVSLPFTPLCFILVIIAKSITSVFCLCIHLLSNIPLAAVPFYTPVSLLVAVSIITTISLWVIWPQRLSKNVLLSFCFTFFVFVVLALLPKQDTSITMLDVGQGDAFLLTSNGSTLLIDTGNNTQKLYAALARAGIVHLDGILITHADDDHCGNISSLQGVVPCDKVFLAEGINEIQNEKTNELLNDSIRYVGESNIEYVHTGDSIYFETMQIEILSPDSLCDEGGNQDSICFILYVDADRDSHVDWRAFFCGDAEAQTVHDLTRSYALENIDILKVAHHGAKASLDDSLAEILKPKIALISVGENNTYGHPAKETISRLEENNAKVLRSDENGDVVCSFTPSEIKIHTLR